MRRHTSTAILALSLASVLSASQAQAVQAPPRISSGGLEAAPGVTPLRSHVMTSYTQIPKARKGAWDAFLADVGSDSWTSLWDTSLGVPLRVFGKGIDAPGTLASAQAAESHARMFIARHSQLFAPGIAPESLELVTNQVNDGMRTVAFRQTAPGATGSAVPVVGGQISVRYKNDRLFVIASEAVPFAKAELPVTSKEAAASMATAWMEGQLHTASVTGPAELVALPLVRERGYEVRTAWRVPVSAGSVRLPYLVYIDARGGKALARDGLARFAQGTALIEAPVRSWLGERKTYAARLAEVGIDGNNATADALGTFSWAGPNAAQLEMKARSADVQVKNMSGVDATQVFSVNDGGQAVWALPNDEFGDAQLSTFIHAGVVKDRARSIAPEMNFLNQTLPANVNLEDKEFFCNAFWDGSSINFFVEFDPYQCSNTGRLADVVYHEFGHAFHQYSMLPGAGQMDGAVGEGTGDYMASTITGDPNVAPGFFQNGGILREIDSDRRWPEDINQDPHETGLIWAGTMWDLRTALVAEMGKDAGVVLADKLFYLTLQRTSSLPTAYAEMIAADDDDGNLENGTPHICTINEAFMIHGLAPHLSASGLTLVHEPIAKIPVSGAPIEVRATQKVLYPQCGDTVLKDVQLLWGGPDQTVNKIGMVKEGEEFVASVPAQADGSAFRYKIEAEVEGATLTLPDNPADDEYRVFVGDVTPIYCNDFESQIDGWTFGELSGGNGDFKWGVTKGLAEDPEKAFSGEKVIGNDLGNNGTYAPEKTAYADSPVIDLGTNTKVRLQFRRWLAVEDGYYDQASIWANGKKVWENQGTDEAFGVLHHMDKEWRFEDIDLSSIPMNGNTTAQIRFQLTSDPGFEAGGWTIDDFCIVAWTPASVDPGPGSTSGTSGGDGSSGAGDEEENGDQDNGPDVYGRGCGCGVATPAPWGWAPLAVLAAGLASRRVRRRRA